MVKGEAEHAATPPRGRAGGKKVTALTIKGARAEARRTGKAVKKKDGRGLYYVALPTGDESWQQFFRVRGCPKLVKATNKEPDISIEDARTWGSSVRAKGARGINVNDERKIAAVNAAEAAKDTLQAVCEEFYRRDGCKLRTAKAQLATLKRYVFGPLGARPIASIKRKEIVRLLDTVADKGPRAADMVLAHLSRIMNWYAIRDDEFVTPIVRGMSRLRKSERARSRILSDDELRAVVTTARKLQTPFALFVLYLLYTAARRREASHLERIELTNNGDWTLPATRNKTKQELLRPLSGAARHVVAMALEQQIDGCKYVFTNDSVHALSGYSALKKQFDAACGINSYTLHDLRRTTRSLMARAGVNVDIAERSLGHTIGGVRGVYDRHRYTEEMRQAYEALAALIERIIDPTDNVIALPGR
jgi:integrase